MIRLFTKEAHHALQPSNTARALHATLFPDDTKIRMPVSNYGTTCTADLHQDAWSCDYMRLWHTVIAATVFSMSHSTVSFAAVGSYHQCLDSVTGMKKFQTL